MLPKGLRHLEPRGRAQRPLAGLVPVPHSFFLVLQATCCQSFKTLPVPGRLVAYSLPAYSLPAYVVYSLYWIKFPELEGAKYRNPYHESKSAERLWAVLLPVGSPAVAVPRTIPILVKKIVCFQEEPERTRLRPEPAHCRVAPHSQKTIPFKLLQTREVIRDKRSTTGTGVPRGIRIMPEPKLKKPRHACCSTLMDAAKASHPPCVERHLKDGSGRDELFRRSYARLPKPLHESAGAKPTRNVYHMSTRNKPACTLCVEAMLAAGADSSWLDEGGRSPLQRAAMVGCVPCIEALLRSPNTKVDAVCDSGSSALLEAVRVKSVAAVRALLAPPASASVAVLPHKYDPPAPLNEALKVGAYDCIEPLVEAGAPLNPTPCTHGKRSGNCYACGSPPLVDAFRGGYADNENEETRLDVLRLFVNRGADVGARSTEWGYRGQTALHVCSFYGRCSCMKVLLDLGADPVALDNDDASALHLAATAGKAEACQILVERITEVSGVVNAAKALLAKDNSGETPLHRASTASCVSMLLRLLEASRGAETVTDVLREAGPESDGRTVVHMAAQREQVDCLRALTDTPEGRRVALEIADNNGFTPMALAQHYGHDFEDIPAFSQVTFVPCCGSVDEAAKKAHVTCVRHFLRDGRPARVEEPEAAGDCATDPMMALSHGSHFRCSKILRVLLAASYRPDGREGFRSPLLHATTDSTGQEIEVCEACAQLLIDAGASDFFNKGRGEICAMSAILLHAGMEGPKACPRSLELARTALNACDVKDDRDGDANVCSWAREGFNLDVVRLLAETTGVDCTAKCPHSGETALHGVVKLQCIKDAGYGEEEALRDSFQQVELVELLVSKVGAHPRPTAA